jgi:uncharacterized protein (TIGR03437 family)
MHDSRQLRSRDLTGSGRKAPERLDHIRSRDPEWSLPSRGHVFENCRIWAKNTVLPLAVGQVHKANTEFTQMKRFRAAATIGYVVLTAATLLPLTLQAQRAPVNLGTAGNFVILSQTGITDVPPSSITGNIGASPITGAAVHLTCAEVTGTISVVDAAGPKPCSLIVPSVLTQAIGDMQTAYTTAAGLTLPDYVEMGAGDISGLTLAPGLYKWSTGVTVNTTVTLSGGPNAVWIFQIAGDLLLANNARIALSGGAQANNVFWQVGGPTAVTIGTGAVFNGTILSAKQVIMNTGASMLGRALAQTQVTLQSTGIQTPGPLVGGIPRIVPPTVTFTVPANHATSVPVGNVITATFSEAMNAATITPLTFTLQNGTTPVSGAVTYVGVTATFTPSLPLLSDVLYTATITTGAADPAGAALSSNYVWSFTSGTALDTNPPTVSSTVPISGLAQIAMNVPVGNTLTATFSEAMNPLTINAATFLLTQLPANTPVAGVVSYAGVTATFKPSTNLAPNTRFLATITTGVANLAGNHMAGIYQWQFATGAGVDTTPPTVSSTVPASGATNVPIGNALAATFSEAMNPLTISTATFTLQQGVTPVAGAVTYVGLTATFTPLNTLAPNAVFTATITTGVTDLAGNAMVSNYVWSFTTGATPDTTPPTVSSTVPANGATSVPIANALAATFSKAMNPLTISTATFTLRQGTTPVPGAVTYVGFTATFTPLGTLAPNAVFTATIATGVTDLAGNALVGNYVWSFTTSATPNTTPPMVSFTVPANGATSVPIGNTLAAAFSEAMNPLTITTATFILKQGATPVSGAVTYVGLTATFTPFGTLAPNTVFTAMIATGVTDLAGNALVGNYTWSFTTGATPNTTPPTVSSTVPASGATSVPIGNALAATFSEAINPSSISTATFTLKQGTTPVSGAVTYVGLTATFTPLGTLAPNAVFTATLTTGVTDLAGNTMAGNYTWSFTTGATPNTTPPTVSFTVPFNGATSVPIGNALAATFSEAINPLTISTATFTLKQGSSPVSGAVTYVGLTATFTPLGTLAPNTVFTATIATGVTDLAGNALVSNYVWSFTTGANPNTTPPVVISTAPASGATNVPIGTALIATFSEAINPLTMTTATFTLMQGSARVSGAVSYAGVTASFTPLSTLAPNAVFTATITTAVADLAGNTLASNYVWSFTTGATPDTTPPTVISTVAVNGAIQVTTTANLVATFSTVMNPLTIDTATFILMQGTTQVPGIVTYAGMLATFIPVNALAPNTVYNATITNVVADLSGNTLASNYLWSFTTGASAGQTPVCLANFAVLAGSAIVGNGSSIVIGDLGVSPGTSMTGFPPGTLTGAMHAGDPAAAQGMADFGAAYGDAVSRLAGLVSVTGDLSGQTFTSGLYASTSLLTISSGTLTLDAKGNANAVFIFQIASTLTTGAGTQIILANGAQPSNVYWQVGATANLGANSVFNGNILADQSITLNTGATVNGRLAARTGTITLQSNIITSPPPAIFPQGTVNAASWTPTVAPGSIAAVFGSNLASTLTSASVYPLLPTLAGSSFQVGSLGAPLYMTSCGQANLQIPWESAGQTQVPVVATVGGLVSVQQPATIAPFAPGIFTLNQLGSGQGVVEIAPTAQLAAPLSSGTGGRPVMPGEYIAIFSTGLGAVTNQPATGAPALSSPLSWTTTLPIITIGGVQAQVTYSGLAPGLVGLYQINAVVPAGIPAGDNVSLVIGIGGIQSNTVTIAVQ